MIINTKFSMEDTVYFMYNNKVTKGTIEGIYIEVNNDKPNEFCPVIQQRYSIREHQHVYDQHELFKSKDKLLKSL